MTFPHILSLGQARHRKKQNNTMMMMMMITMNLFLLLQLNEKTDVIVLARIMVLDCVMLARRTKGLQLEVGPRRSPKTSNPNS